MGTLALVDKRFDTEPSRRSPWNLTAHGVAGWAISALVLVAVLRFSNPHFALALHAALAPLVFVGVAWHYFRQHGPRHEPIPAALAMTVIVAVLDAGVVGGILLRGLAMLTTIGATCLPLSLVFVATAVTGLLLTRGEGAARSDAIEEELAAKSAHPSDTRGLIRGLVVTLAAFTAISAIGGAVELTVWRDGTTYNPISLLAHTPFTTFLVPALLLGVVIGGLSTMSAWLTWRRSPAAPDATALAGGALLIWVLAEAALMRLVHWLQITYGVIGVALVVLALQMGLRSHKPRYQWLAKVTLAEAVGFLVPAFAGVIAARAEVPDSTRLGIFLAAGFCEGLALGLGQAWAFPMRVRKWRYAALTAVGASLVWTTVLATMLVLGTGTLPTILVVLIAAGCALIGLLAIGTAQWFELRYSSDRALSWIGWTALAWMLALPLSFLPGPLVDESTPTSSQLVLWGLGGVLMAFVMASVTWLGARRLAGRPIPG
ncbi:MAG: hypothetical protein U0271_02480 [Polyangiaceae bacterium]